MTTPPIGFQDRLLDALLSEHTALTGPVYAIAPVPPRTRRRSPRHPALSLTAGAVVAGAAAAAVVVTVPHTAATTVRHAHTPSVAPAPSVTATGHLPAHEDVAYVLRRMRTAAQVNDAVVEEIVRAPDSQTGAPTLSELWSQHGNPTSLDISLDAAGRPEAATQLTRGASTTTSTTIDYAVHTYSTRTFTPAPSGGPGPAPATLSGGAAQLRAVVATGQATLVGPATVDGRRTLEIISRTDHGTTQTYVDPDTYLPIREVDIPVGGSVTGPSTITDDARYLPDTAASRSKLTPAGAIPRGFHKAG